MEKQPNPRKHHITMPRLIIHGGAGNITPTNLPSAHWAPYKANLLRIYHDTNRSLQNGVSALDAATHAVFTRDGTIELEASVMTTRNYHKRATALVLLNHVKNPIKLAREMLIRGQTDGGNGDNGGGLGDPAGGWGSAQGHCCLGGATAERLAKEWGLEMVEENYFKTKKRWDEHRRGLENDEKGSGGHGRPYLPQGTVGCVALDREGMICVATSTGGLTNKLPMRIGDTPTIGAGFWGEEWFEDAASLEMPLAGTATNSVRQIIDRVRDVLSDCLPNFWNNNYSLLPQQQSSHDKKKEYDHQPIQRHALALSGTGNGDSFLRLSACRTAGSIVRFSSPLRSLASAITQIAGPGGELQRSAGERWGTGEGEGGMIGIELSGRGGRVVWDFNCGGMMRCYGDEAGRVWVGVFRETEEGPFEKVEVAMSITNDHFPTRL
ncbi:MAG: hypothetical protein Q9164_001738 [Protoblastenia rupestris]